jgi:hypothetical protein
VHDARLALAHYELAPAAVWKSLARDACESVVVSFHGRAGLGGTVEAVTYHRRVASDLVYERYWWRDELAYALEAPVWER